MLHFRNQVLIAVAEKIRMQLPVDISAAQLRQEMLLVLHHPTSHGTLQASKDLLLILVVGMQVENPDSRRLKELVMPELYLANHSDLQGSEFHDYL